MAHVWDLEPHTAAKHRILREYLKAWFPIVARLPKVKRLLYVDAFAGPGVYSKGEDGSPIVAIRTALEHAADFPAPVRFVFIEKDRATHASLKAKLDAIRAEVAVKRPNFRIDEPIHGDAAEVIRKAAGPRPASNPLGPAFFFLDQFGYSDIPLDLLGRVLAFPRCEVFTFLYVNGIVRFLDQPEKHGAITFAFGDESWRGVIAVPPERRYTWLVDLYRKKLEYYAQYLWDFTMCDATGQPRYTLFFATNHERGLEVMKDAMLRVDETGEFRFSDAADPGQLVLLSRATDTWMKEHLARVFAGRTVTVDEVRRHVLERTPVTKYRSLLGDLESAGVIEVPNPPQGRKKRAFTDTTMELRFKPHQPGLLK